MAASSSQSSRLAGANRAALIIVGVLSLLGLAYAIARVDILRARIVVLHTDLDRTREDLAAVTTQLQALQITQTQDSAQLQQAQDTLSHLSSGLNRQISQATQQWTRAEVLYLTRLAQDQLQHAHDPDGARASLEAALSSSLAQPGTIGDEVQQQLQAALTTLNALPAGQGMLIEQQLQSAEQQVAVLPLAAASLQQNAATTDNSDTAWQRFWTRLQQAAGQLILVRRSGEQASMVVSEQHALLQRQYLSQQLLAARLAAARHDQQAYIQSLNVGLQWLDQAFDTAQPGTQTFRKQWLTLKTYNVAPTLPDLNNSIAVLQKSLDKEVTP